jgi:hypothetical protein
VTLAPLTGSDRSNSGSIRTVPVNQPDDPWPVSVRANWSAILESGPGEAAFCRTAAEIGVDPYALEDVSPLLLSLLEAVAEDSDPIVHDFFEAVQPSSAPETWKWVEAARRDLHLGAGGEAVLRQTGARALSPWSVGRQAAMDARCTANIPQEAPIGEIPEVGAAIGIKDLVISDRNHVPDGAVRAAVGWPGSGSAVITGPVPQRSDNRRFYIARGLYHAAFACKRGPRLVTSAHTWEQQASRAFAAELLAPREALLSEISSVSTVDDADALIEDLAGRFNVSTRVIDHQLENAGLRLGAE